MAYSVVAKKDSRAKQQVAAIIAMDHADTCGIVYCTTRADTVEMAYVLKEQGITATFYHAGMESEEHAQNATLWLDGKANVMCCTGIDKQDV